jgi:hypothetical protein
VTLQDPFNADLEQKTISRLKISYLQNKLLAPSDEVFKTLAPVCFRCTLCFVVPLMRRSWIQHVVQSMPALLIRIYQFLLCIILMPSLLSTLQGKELRFMELALISFGLISRIL